jgi:large subunit ribosomal protein L9
MKVILNKDLAPLGEEGDIKEVARGYARNYLFPRGIAMPHTDKTVAILESRRGEIEARKEEKRKDALGLKEKLEELELLIVMPAGANGRLYGAVTGQTVADELAKQGFQIERKRIELPGNSFKSVGKYKVALKLYESASAELSVAVEGQPLKVETPSAPARRDRRRRDDAPSEESRETASGSVATEPLAAAAETAPTVEPVAAVDPAVAATETAAVAGTGGEGPAPASEPVMEESAAKAVVETVAVETPVETDLET